MYKRNIVFFGACIGLFVFGMTLITLGSILPQLKVRFTEDELNAGILAAVLPIGILLGSLVFGPIVDHYGYKLLLIVSVIISAVALAGLAMTKSATLIYPCIFFIGFGGGIINGGTSALVADISSEHKGASLSLLGVSYGVGAAGLPFLLGVLLEHYSYPTILTAVSLFMLLPVLYFLFIKFPTPKQPQGFPLKEGVNLLKEKLLLVMAFFLFFQSGAESLVSNWTTSFLKNKLGTDDEKALYALSFSLIGLTVARLLLGGLLKRISSFTIMIFSLLLVAVGSLILMNTRSYNLAFAALIIMGAGLAGGFPVIMGYIGQLFSQLSGTAFSIALVIALVGNTLINTLFGWVSRNYSINYQPVAILISVCCMMFLMIVIKQKVSAKIKI